MFGQDNVDQAKKMKGYLEKKSPKFLAGYQKRYFMVIDEGLTLAYYQNDKATVAKGVIQIDQITDIKVSNKKDFTLIIPGKSFQLRASSESIRNNWVEMLNLLKKHYEGKGRTGSAHINSNVKKAWKVDNLDEVSKSKLRAQSQIVKQKTQENGHSESDENKSIENKYMMQKINIFDYLSKIPQDVLQKRILAGWLQKRKKGKVKMFQRRWFIIITSKPLIFEDSEFDEVVLLQKQLPETFQLNVLYYYKFEGGAAEKKGEIELCNCLSIIEKNMEKSSEKGFSFKINLGDRLFHLQTKTREECQDWKSKLENSIKIAKEADILKKQKIVVTKNIDFVINKYDKAKHDKATQEQIINNKMKNDLKEIQKKINLSGSIINKIDDLFTYLTNLSKELFDVVYVCKVKEFPRIDIINKFIKFFHDEICKTLKTFWDTFYSSLMNDEFIKIFQWIDNYASTFHEFLIDERLIQAKQILLKTFQNRIVGSALQLIDNLVANINDQETGKTEYDYISTAPNDIFRIIYDTIEFALQFSVTQELLQTLAQFANKVLRDFSKQMDIFLDDFEGDIKQTTLTNFANSTMQMSKKINKFSEYLEDLKLPEKEIEQYLETFALKQEFIQLGTVAKDQFVQLITDDLVQKSQKIKYLKYDLEQIIPQILEKYADDLQSLHSGYNKKVWKDFLNNLVVLYFQIFVTKLNKCDKHAYDKYLNKMEADNEYLIETFKQVLDENSLIEIFLPFFDLKTFIIETDNTMTMVKTCIKLRQYFGKGFNVSTVKLILKLKKKDRLKKPLKRDLIEQCAQTLYTYNKEHQETEEKQTSHVLMSFQNVEDTDSPPGTQQQLDSSQSHERRASLTLDLNDLDGEEDKPTEELTTENEKRESAKKSEEKEELITEGFVIKNNSKRYIRILNGFLYIYANERSRQSKNKINLQNISDCQKVKNTFYVKTEKKNKIKEYKFQIATEQLCEKWFKSIVKNLQTIEAPKVEQQLFNAKEILFQDYDEIERQKYEQNMKEKFKYRTSLLLDGLLKKQVQETISNANAAKRSFGTKENSQEDNSDMAQSQQLKDSQQMQKINLERSCKLELTNETRKSSKHIDQQVKINRTQSGKVRTLQFEVTSKGSTVRHNTSPKSSSRPQEGCWYAFKSCFGLN